MNTTIGFSTTSCFKLFPTIDRSYLRNDGYCEDDSFLDIDYQEADYGNDLDCASPNCEKSAQHDEFIDIDSFCLENLPSAIRHPSVYVWIRYCSQLVVRISHNSNATGRVFVIKDHLNKNYPCKNIRCPYITSYGDDHIVKGGLGIITNTHVVKNNDEAKEARVELFYHNDNRRSSEVIKEYGHIVYATNQNFDYTMFTCNMHQPRLVWHIETCTDIAAHAWRCIPVNIRRELKNFAIVISHPHGTSKKISIGKVIGSEWRKDSKEAIINQQYLRSLYQLCEKSRKGLKRFTIYFSLLKDIALLVKVTYYNAATCPGSSGAPVYMGKEFVENGLEVNPPHTHRGKHPVNGYNNCYT